MKKNNAIYHKKKYITKLTIKNAQQIQYMDGKKTK